MQNKAKKKITPMSVLMVLLTLAFVVIAVYVVAQLVLFLRHTYKTETAIVYTMADSVTLPGVAVFDSTDVEGQGSLGYLVQDGERVTGGTVLAEQYTNEEQGALRERLDRLERTISLLVKSQNSTGNDLTMLTTQTRQAMYDLLDQLGTRQYGGISDAAEELLLAQNRLQISTGQSGGFGDVIASLQADRDEVQAQLGQLSTIEAQTNGYFVSANNASFLAPDAALLAADTPAELSAQLDAGMPLAGSGLAGRIVTGFSWKFYAVCDLETAARFDGVSSVNISVPGKQNTPLAAAVLEVAQDEESGMAKITLECQSINANVLRLGQEEAQIDLTTYQGIRFDRTALHILNGAKGVYVKYGDLQRFRKITILYENENYILVPMDGALGTDNEVRLYDEIIVEGTNLQDGKLL